MQKKFQQVEPLYRRLLTVKERVLGIENEETLTTVSCFQKSCFGCLYHKIFYTRHCSYIYYCLYIHCFIGILFFSHFFGTKVNNLASVLQEQQKWEEAEILCQRDLEWCERVLGVDHEDTVSVF